MNTNEPEMARGGGGAGDDVELIELAGHLGAPHDAFHGDAPAHCPLCEKHHYGSTPCPMKPKTVRVRIAVVVFGGERIGARAVDSLFISDNEALESAMRRSDSVILGRAFVEANIPIEPAETIEARVVEVKS